MVQREDIIQDIFSTSATMQRAVKGYLYNAHRTPEGLTPGQGHILMLLKEKPRMKGKDLAKYMHFSPSAVSQVIDSLDDAGLISREHDARDRRITY